jgi:hypothetical protein
MDGKLGINHKRHKRPQNVGRAAKVFDHLHARSQQPFCSTFVPLRVLCGYFFLFFAGAGVSGCAPVTLAST